MALLRGAPVPPVRRVAVLTHAVAAGVHVREIELCGWVAEVGGTLRPARGLGVVEGDAVGGGAAVPRERGLEHASLLRRRLIPSVATGAAVAAAATAREAVAAPAKWARPAANQVDSQALKVLYPEYRYRSFSTPTAEAETVRSCMQRMRVRQSRRRTINH